MPAVIFENLFSNSTDAWTEYGLPNFIGQLVCLTKDLDRLLFSTRLFL